MNLQIAVKAQLVPSARQALCELARLSFQNGNGGGEEAYWLESGLPGQRAGQLWHPHP